MGGDEVGGGSSTGQLDRPRSTSDEVGRIASELHEIVASVRSPGDLARLKLPALDELCELLGKDRSQLITDATAAVAEPDYRRFFEILLPLPFQPGEIWPALGRKYISEQEAGRGVRAGFEVFGVTTWDGLNAALAELGGMSRRGVAERELAAAMLSLEPSNGPRRGSEADKRRRVAIASVLGALLVVAVVVALVFAGEGDDEGEAGGGGSSEKEVESDPADAAEQSPIPETTPAQTATPDRPGGSTMSLPESNLGGIQPNVEPLAGEDRSAELAAALAEEQLVFFDLGEIEPVDAPYYGLAIRPPARFRYQAFNRYGDEVACRGMMSRELDVVGLWERRATWEQGHLQVAVGELANQEMAHELATALALDVGVSPGQCRGLGTFNVTDYDDYGVDRDDLPNSLPPQYDSNHWIESDVAVAGQVWPHGRRLIVEHGRYVIDIALLGREQVDTNLLDAPGKIAAQVVSRLPA